MAYYRLTPSVEYFAMPLFDHVLDVARRKLRRVVLPESSDDRILRAAFEAHRQGLASPVLLGDADSIDSHADKLGIDLSGIDIVTPASHERHEHYVRAMIEKRKERGITERRAVTALDNTLTYACMMVSEGDADACVAGAITSTAKVVSNAKRYVGKHEDASIVSSCFIMLLNPGHPVADAVVVGDCALIIEPDAEQLAAIAVATGESACQFLQREPQVAMLSFSTGGSARHASVSKVAQATALVRQRRPLWRVVGEVQLDAAVIPSILAAKAPEHATGDPCNVLIFPNLDAGNIGYKLIERFGNAEAIGPILQGLAQPVNDLSRGCSVEDIVKIIAISAAQVRPRTWHS